MDKRHWRDLTMGLKMHIMDPGILEAELSTHISESIKLNGESAVPHQIDTPKL